MAECMLERKSALSSAHFYVCQRSSLRAVHAEGKSPTAASKASRARVICACCLHLLNAPGYQIRPSLSLLRRSPPLPPSSPPLPPFAWTASRLRLRTPRHVSVDTSPRPLRSLARVDALYNRVRIRTRRLGSLARIDRAIFRSGSVCAATDASPTGWGELPWLEAGRDRCRTCRCHADTDGVDAAQ